MTLKSDAKFKGKLTQGLNYGIRNLVNFHAGSRSQICSLGLASKINLFIFLLTP